MVLMGSMGVPFPITDGLERVWNDRAMFLGVKGVRRAAEDLLVDIP